jgi:alpha-glucoside transport system substrate-binding protein
MSDSGTDAAPIRPEPSRTLRELTRRRLALLLLTVLASVALHHAFQGVNAEAGPLRTSTVPGVLAVDTAMDALTDAQNGIDPEQGAATGEFHTRISVANQSLARAAAADVTGLSGRQTIQTVTGLIATYSGWIEDATGQPANSVLRKAYLQYAAGMLGTRARGAAADPTIMGRLAELRAGQQDVLRRQSDFGPLQWAQWSVAAVFVLALLALLAEAHAFSGARFRRRWNPPLALGVLLLAGGAAALAVFTALSRAALADAREQLTPALTSDAIPKAGAAVAARLSGTGFRAAAADWIWAGGLLLAALALLALQPRIGEYRVSRAGAAAARRWRAPRPRALGVIAGCLVLLAGGGAYAVQAAGWHGSVTLLANWTGDEQRDFQEKVIDAFEHKYRIHVVYQGSSAESQVLDADVESGTPPDVAVLPGPGELAGYAGEGLLAPLDDVARPAGFPATWVPKVKGPDGVAHTYWVPIKTDLKSMVWYPPSRVAASAVATDARDPASWCLGMASDATSGWPGSDWIEDILLQQSGSGTYQDWVAGKVPWTDPEVRRAWTTWGELVGAGRAPYAETALTTSFGDAARNTTPARGTCELEHQASFARGTRDFVHSAAVIPGADASGAQRWEVSGDLAAVLHETPQSRKLITYLASAQAQRAWARTQSGFSVEHTVLAGYPGGGSVPGRIATALRDPGAVRCYDASDAMPSTVRDAFALAVLRYLADPSSLDGLLTGLERITRGSVAGTTVLTSVCSGGGS